MPQDLTDDKLTLVQVMAWCRRQQAITWTSVDQDLQRHMLSLSPNELNSFIVMHVYNNCILNDINLFFL